MNKSDTYYISNLEHSNPLKSSPGNHSQLVSDSVGVPSSCSLLVFLGHASHHHVYVASASQYPNSHNCA